MADKYMFPSTKKSIFDSSPLREIVVHNKKSKKKYKNKDGAIAFRNPEGYFDPETRTFKGKINVVVHNPMSTRKNQKKQSAGSRRVRKTRNIRKKKSKRSKRRTRRRR